MLSDSYVPERLVARETQVAEIDRWLSVAVDTRSPKHLWIHGPSGSGKTAAVLGSINRLQGAYGIETAVINCWQHGTYFEVLDALVAEFRILRAEEHRSSLKLERIRRHLRDKQCIIVVDEVDRMPPSERSVTLYNLTQLGSVSLVCVSNQDNVYSTLWMNGSAPGWART